MTGNTFLSVFAKSPLKPIEHHIDTVAECCKLLKPLLQSIYAAEWEKAHEIREQINQQERKADELKKELRTNLPKGIFLPVDRRELLALLSEQDRLANTAQSIANRLLARQLSIPQSLHADLSAYMDRCLDATSLAQVVINELDELLETGFKGREVEAVERMIDELEKIDDDTEAMRWNLYSAVHSIESDTNPVDVMFIYDLIDRLASLATSSDNVGGKLELLLSN